MKFLEKLQNSDEGIKRRWLFILTAISMAAVIYVWLAYFNSLISGAASPAPEFAEGGNGFTFWGTMKMGAAAIYEGAMGKLRSLGEILTAPREYIITPK